MDGTPTTAGRRDLSIAAGLVLLALVLMAWDHLWGNQDGSDDSVPVDPVTFVLSLGLILRAAGVVFLVTVPRAARAPEKVHRGALWHSGVAAVLALPASWLGFPAVVAGGGIALGLRALGGKHPRLALVAILLGLVVVVLGILATAFPPSDPD